MGHFPSEAASGLSSCLLHAVHHRPHLQVPTDTPVVILDRGFEAIIVDGLNRLAHCRGDGLFR